jgi:hypothetical protein
MMGEPQSLNDRRERNRFEINAPVTVLDGRREMPGFTRDLNNLGVYFYLNLADGASVEGDLEFLLELPPEVTLSTSCMVRCKGRVVRTDDASTQLTGIAARILDYSIGREEALSA